LKLNGWRTLSYSLTGIVLSDMKIYYFDVFFPCIPQSFRAWMHCPRRAEQVYLNCRTWSLFASPSGPNRKVIGTRRMLSRCELGQTYLWIREAMNSSHKEPENLKVYSEWAPKISQNISFAGDVIEWRSHIQEKFFKVTFQKKDTFHMFYAITQVVINVYPLKGISLSALIFIQLVIIITIREL